MWLDGPDAKERACKERLRGERVHRTPDAEEALGFRWKRPKYVLGRPDPHHESKEGR